MAYPGIFRVDPPPVQPAPHVPIPAQGQQPPVGPTALAVYASVLRLAWEPPWTPAQRAAPVTPWATITYGNQPPLGQQEAQINASSCVAAWPPVWWPSQQAPWLAPMTLTYGQQPPSYSIVAMAGLVQSWQPPDPPPRQLPLTVAPLTLVYGNQPPLGNWPADVALPSIEAQWPPIWWPSQQAPWLAPMTLTYGQQPPVGNWPADVAMPSIEAQWPPVWWPIQKAPWLAPMTLTYGQQPPIGAQPFTVSENILYASWPGIWWPSQSAAPTAGWNVPPVTAAPPTSQVNLNVLLRSWVPPDPPPVQKPSNIVALTLTYGQQPPVGNWPQDVALPSIEAQWPPPWYPAQSAAPSASWNTSVITNPPPTSLANLNVLLRSWVPPDPAPWQKPLTIVPLTLTYGQQPPPYSTIDITELVQTWQPPDPLPRQLPLTIAPLTLIYGDQPPTYSTVNMIGAALSWVPPPPPPWQKPLTFAPLTLTYGQQPPPTTTQAVQAAPLPWQPPWTPAQIAAPSAGWNVPRVDAPPPRSWVNAELLLRSWRPADPPPRQLPPTQFAMTAAPTIIGGSWIEPFRGTIWTEDSRPTSWIELSRPTTWSGPMAQKLSPKRPLEHRLWTADFSKFPEIVAGDTLSSVVSATATLIGSAVSPDTPPTLTSPAVVAGNKMTVIIDGGTAGNTYRLDLTALTTAGWELTAVAELPVSEN